MRRLLGGWIRDHRMHIAVAAAVCYVAALGMVVLVFPDVSNLWVSVFVLVGGAVQAVLGIADLLQDTGDDLGSAE